jgi:hypothetical protein
MAKGQGCIAIISGLDFIAQGKTIEEANKISMR